MARNRLSALVNTVNPLVNLWLRQPTDFIAYFALEVNQVGDMVNAAGVEGVWIWGIGDMA